MQDLGVSQLHEVPFVPLPSPQVVADYLDVGFIPPVAATVLQWPDSVCHDWQLPTGERLSGPLPRRFGVRLRRQNEDAYNLALVWDSTYRQWFSLRRKEIVSSDLETILAALGVCLGSLLDQPVGSNSGAA